MIKNHICGVAMSTTNNLSQKLTVKRDLSPEGRNFFYKGRIGEAMRVISENMLKLVILNLIMIVACVPLIVMVLYYQRQEEAAAIAGMNFSTGIGIGFGVRDDTVAALANIYDVRLKVYGLTIFPTCLLFGLFASGLFYCCRNMLWKTKVKVFKHFFRGIKAHWYKYMLSFAWLGALATGFACGLIMILKGNAVNGSANAGWWVLVVATGLLALLSAMYMMIGNSMYVCYKYKMSEYIKNTCVLVLMMILPTLMVTLFFTGAMALSFVSFIGVFILVIMALIGFSALAVFNLAFGQYACDNIIGFMYEENMKIQMKEQEKQNKARKKQKQNSSRPNNKRKR